MLVEETARDVKIINAISALEFSQIESISIASTEATLLTDSVCYFTMNCIFIIPEAMRTTIVAMLHHGHAAADKMENAAGAFWWPGMYREIQRSPKTAPAAELQVRNLKRK